MRVSVKDLRALVAKKAYDAEIKGWGMSRLYNCSAYVIPLSDIVVLKSYNTYVAHYDMNTENIIVYDSYSATTTQHVAKFEKYIKENYLWESTVYPYFRGDSIIVRDKNGGITWKYERDLYPNQYERRKANASMRKFLIDTEFRFLCDLPKSLEDEYVAVSANYEEHDKLMRNYYGMTRW